MLLTANRMFIAELAGVGGPAGVIPTFLGGTAGEVGLLAVGRTLPALYQGWTAGMRARSESVSQHVEMESR